MITLSRQENPLKILKSTVLYTESAYPLSQLADPDKILFLDIETTGFSAINSSLYLIGCITIQNKVAELTQFFADCYEDEEMILRAFFAFSKSYSFLIHFNGNQFDLPFLLQKAKQYNLSDNFDDFTGIDLYKRISPYRNFLKLPNCKQKTLETFLNINREDLYNGGELIKIYHEFVQSSNSDIRELLLLHNKEDMTGMFQMLPILFYTEVLSGNFKIVKVQANYYKDMDGIRKLELLMKLKFSFSLPVSVSYAKNNCYFTAFDQEGVLKVPIYEEEMKYFYADYKNYYYLPMEDIALHKSVAGFVDTNHRIHATAATCYTRKLSTYLPQWQNIISPFFKRNYSDKELFFELTEEMKSDRELFKNYASHILNSMI